MPSLLRLKKVNPRRRMPRQLHPVGIQVEYYATLRAMVDYAHALVKERLLSKLPELLTRHTLDDTRLDAQPPGKRVNTIMDGIAAAMQRRFPQKRMEALGKRIAEATQAHQKRELNKQIDAAMGVKLPDFNTPKLNARIGQFTSENVALIKTVPQQYFSQIESTVLEGVREGTRHEQIAKDIEERYGVAKERAKLIARDQVGKFYAELNQVRQKQLGIDGYIWRTSNDARVREWHQEREGLECSWAEGPGDASDPGDGEHPGEGINCRCYSEPNLAPILEE